MANDTSIEVTGFLAEDLKSIVLEHAGVMPRVFGPWKGKRLALVVKKHSRRRTLAQNRYIHGPVCASVWEYFMEREGKDFEHDYIYTFLRKLCGHTIEIKVMNGMEVIAMTGKRFSQMNIEEFGRAIDKIKKHFAKKDWEIPEPRGDNFWGDYENYNKNKDVRDE